MDMPFLSMVFDRLVVPDAALPAPHASRSGGGAVAACWRNSAAGALLGDLREAGEVPLDQLQRLVLGQSVGADLGAAGEEDRTEARVCLGAEHAKYLRGRAVERKTVRYGVLVHPHRQ